MGIYLDEDRSDGLLLAEVMRQRAVDKVRPLRLRGDPALDGIVRAAALFYDTAVSSISIIDRDQQLFVARTGIDLWGTPREASFCAVAIQRPGEPLIVPDARQDPRFARKSSVVASPNIRFYAGITVVDPFGYPLGALCVFDPAPRTDRVDTTMLASLALEVERIVGRSMG